MSSDRRSPDRVPAGKLPKRPGGLPPRRSHPVPPPPSSYWQQVKRSSPGVTTAPATMADAAVAPARRWSWAWWLNWKFLLVSSLLVCGASGGLALAYLLQLPGLPNCPAVFWPLASASMRFECARIAASKQTAQDLLEAIALVDSLPNDHPLRDEADRMVELWSRNVLDLAEELFNNGKLEEAIAAARKIPAKASSAKLVEDRVRQWEATWKKAEEIYRNAEAAIRKRQWRKAFTLAVRLLNLENRYWETTKYDELTQRINVARQEGEKLYKAERLVDRGGLDNFLEAIQLAREIAPKSDLYAEAQATLASFGKQMLDLAQATVDGKNSQLALEILSKIPPEAKLEKETADLTVLTNAQSYAWGNTVAGLQEAIAQAQRISADRPYFLQAQKLMTRWQLEIEALARLEQARLTAQNGNIENLQAAITQANQIPESNPRWSEAQKEIDHWRNEAETIEDQPLLDQAEQLAMRGDVVALQAAIAQAQRIPSGRALYNQAQRRIADWDGQIQTQEDQPYLDQARDYARAGNLNAAIAAADQIRSGRALYGQAQKEAAGWRQQIQATSEQRRTEAAQSQAQEVLQSARQTASVGSTSALMNAIQLANQVPDGNALRAEARTLINDWSGQLLRAAEDRAWYDPATAISIAQKIPASTDLYSEAQTKIKLWEAAATQKPRTP